MTTAEATAPTKERWSFSWKHLYDEVVTTGLCTGCAGCVIACPHDVLGYDDTNGVYKPIQLEADYGGPRDCSHGDKACTSCTRACPRFRAWEPEIDESMFGRVRRPDEVSGIYKDICLARATDPGLHEVGQDGGLVSAILVYALEHDIIDAALVSYLEGDGSTWRRYRASRAHARTSSRPRAVATRTPRTRWRTWTSTRRTSASRSSA
jgi:coenzyme F420 hydrogenase subunit beta